MHQNTEIKTIMRQLREQKDIKNESLVTEAEVDTENDSSDLELQLARLEDIISRFEKVVNAAGEDEEAPAEEAPAEKEEAPAEEAPAEEEEALTEEEEAPAEEGNNEEESAEESYSRSLERRISNLERKFTESRRRKLCGRFNC